MNCPECGYALPVREVLPPEPDQETVTVGPVTLVVSDRARQAAIIGARWSLGILLVFGVILVDMIVFDRGMWPVGLAFIGVQIGGAVAVFWYLEPDLFL